MKPFATLSLAPDETPLLGPALDWVRAWGRDYAPLPAEELDRFVGEIAATLALMVERHRIVGSAERIEIRAGRDGDGPGAPARLELAHRGAPLFEGDWRARAADGGARFVREWKNLGREGQLLVYLFAADAASIAAPGADTPAAPRADRFATSAAGGPDPAHRLEDLVLRALAPEEIPRLCELFHAVYEYHYVNETVYHPERLDGMVRAGELECFVAVDPDGAFHGHVGLLRKNGDPLVYEAVMGIVDPRTKVRGVFTALFARVMERAREIPMSYCFYDFVTNHEFTQRSSHRHGITDLALLIGCQRSDTQARLGRLGLGADSESMDRYSLLCAISPNRPYPFGRSIALPGSSGSLFDLLLKPLKMEWTPRSRFDAIASIGAYESTKNAFQKSVAFDLVQPGRRAIAELCEEWKALRKLGYLHALVSSPLDLAGNRFVYDELSRNGFFIAGLLPYRFSGRLALAMQSVGPTRVAWDDLKIYSESGRELLKAVRASYERNLAL